jgi:hypothetical protein
MPHVLEAPDILEEHTAPSPACNELHALPLALPSSRRARSRLLAFLRRLITPAPRLRTRRQEYCTPSAPRFETSLDILAREYPNIHLRVMAGMG